MKNIATIILTLSLFLGCSKDTPTPKKIAVCLPEQKNIDEDDTNALEEQTDVVRSDTPRIMFDFLPNTYLLQSSFEELPNWHEEDYNEALSHFLESCKTSRTKAMYKSSCRKAKYAINSKEFIQREFFPYMINTENGKEEGLLTGYYEPELRGSLEKTDIYKYPIYATPENLIIVELSSIYPQLKHLRLRGKLEGNKLVPYETREQTSSKHIPANVICYTDSKIDLFFLEVQGSGRVLLENGKTLYIGYDNQNGHRYRSIGKYLVKIGALELEKVSLQTIRAWLDENPSRVDEILNYNKSVVYFKEDKLPASGSLGVCLTPERSIAVDRRYIPLGSMLYLNAEIQDKSFAKLVLAQDTGGAIKGAIRADMFLGCGDKAMNTAGELKSPLKLWILLPKNTKAMDS